MSNKIRCSQADRVMACSGSLIAIGHPYDPPSEVASTGHAAHEVIENIVMNPGVDVPRTVEDVAEARGCDLSELEFLASEARRAWSAIRGMLPQPQVEIPLEGPHCYGRADLVSYGVDHAAVVDWKFGHDARRHPHQMTGYASCLRALVGVPSSGYIDTIEVQCRLGTWHHVKLSAEYIDAWERDLARRIKQPADAWAPCTAACRYCPARVSCPARMDYLRDAAAWLGDAVDVGPSRDTIARTYDRADSLRQALQQFDAAVADAIIDAPLELPDGRTVSLRETKREEINVEKAWPVLHSELGWAARDMLGILKTTKKSLTDRIRVDVPHGEKISRTKEIFSALDAVGAIETKRGERKDVR